jgi:DnaA-homolog protein
MMPGGHHSFRQQPLAFPPREPYALSDFVVGANGELLTLLDAIMPRARFQCCWVSGPAGAGKTHLLQGACHAVASRGGLVAYVPLRAVHGEAEAFAGLDDFDLIAIDDVDVSAGARMIEEALLALYQAMSAHDQGTLLLAAPVSAQRSSFALADLASRFRAAASYPLRELDDDGKGEVLRRYAARNGLDLRHDVRRWLLERGPRALPELLRLVDRLDAAAAAAQRRLTLPFARSVLDL